MNPSSTAAANKALVSQVMNAVFVRRDCSVVERHFAKGYVLHNPSFPNGRDAIPGLIGNWGGGFGKGPEMIAEEGNWVIFPGLYLVGGPRPWVGVNFFGVVEG